MKQEIENMILPERRNRTAQIQASTQ